MREKDIKNAIARYIVNGYNIENVQMDCLEFAEEKYADEIIKKNFDVVAEYMESLMGVTPKNFDEYTDIMYDPANEEFLTDLQDNEANLIADFASNVLWLYTPSGVYVMPYEVQSQYAGTSAYVYTLEDLPDNSTDKQVFDVFLKLGKGNLEDVIFDWFKTEIKKYL